MQTRMACSTFYALLSALLFAGSAADASDGNPGNPLADLDNYTYGQMAKCLDDDTSAHHCFSSVMDQCSHYVQGYALNWYPCSTNTRMALRETVEKRLQGASRHSEILGSFNDALRLGYEMCGQLDQLVSEVSSRLSIQGEGCLNSVTMVAADEVLGALR